MRRAERDSYRLQLLLGVDDELSSRFIRERHDERERHRENPVRADAVAPLDEGVTQAGGDRPIYPVVCAADRDEIDGVEQTRGQMLDEALDVPWRIEAMDGIEKDEVAATLQSFWRYRLQRDHVIALGAE